MRTMAKSALRREYNSTMAAGEVTSDNHRRIETVCPSGSTAGIQADAAGSCAPRVHREASADFVQTILLGSMAEANRK